MMAYLHPFEDVLVVVICTADPGVGCCSGEEGEHCGDGTELHFGSAGCMMWSRNHEHEG